MRAPVAVPGIIAGALLLVSCSYQQSVIHPRMAAPTAADIALSCGQLDLAIDRADTVRWVIRDDGGELETSGEKAGRYAANAIIVPISLLTYTGNYIKDGGHAVLNAVDQRLLKLLELKRDRHCPARETSVAGSDDRALADELEAVQVRIENGDGNQAEQFEARTRLLDGLRVVPLPTAAAPAEAPRY